MLKHKNSREKHNELYGCIIAAMKEDGFEVSGKACESLCNLLWRKYRLEPSSTRWVVKSFFESRHYTATISADALIKLIGQDH
jgi:hypothetical protein